VVGATWCNVVGIGIRGGVGGIWKDNEWVRGELFLWCWEKMGHVRCGAGIKRLVSGDY